MTAKIVRTLCMAVLFVGMVVFVMMAAEYLPFPDDRIPGWVQDATSWMPARDSSGGTALIAGSIVVICLAALGVAAAERNQHRSR